MEPRLTRTRIAGLLLAAGQGRRAGGPKALRVTAAGQAWAVRAVRALFDGGCDEVHAVIGAAAEQVRAVLADQDVRVVEAADWRHGMGASLRAGLTALQDTDADIACVHLVDLPDVGPDVVARVLQAAAGPDTLARAAYLGVPGHPVLLGRAHWPAVSTGPVADRGARELMARHPPRLVECGDLATGCDVDRFR